MWVLKIRTDLEYGVLPLQSGRCAHKYLSSMIDPNWFLRAVLQFCVKNSVGEKSTVEKMNYYVFGLAGSFRPAGEIQASS